MRFPALFVLLSVLVASPILTASPIRYEFSVSGLTGGGVLSGSFLAEDLNNDSGILKVLKGDGGIIFRSIVN